VLFYLRDFILKKKKNLILCLNEWQKMLTSLSIPRKTRILLNKNLFFFSMFKITYQFSDASTTTEIDNSTKDN